MLAELMKFNVPAESWVEFFVNINPIVREELEWDLDGNSEYVDAPGWKSFMEGYNLFLEQERLFNNPEYREMLSICGTISTDVIIFDPDKYVYWKKVHEFITKLFEDVPALAVSKDSQLSQEDRAQVYSGSKDSSSLKDIAAKIIPVAGNDEYDTEAFVKYIQMNPHLFHVGEVVTDNRTDYTRIYKRRAVLRSCLKSIEFLLRRYEENVSPNSWRRL